MNEKFGGSVWRPQVDYTYTRVKVSENPDISDWRKMHSKLVSVDMFDNQTTPGEIYNGSMFSVVYGSAQVNKTFVFLWEKHRREVSPNCRKKYTINYRWNPECYRERKYFCIKLGNSCEHIQSHGNETPLLLPNEICKGIFSDFDNSIPSDPESTVIFYKDVVRTFRKTICM